MASILRSSRRRDTNNLIPDSVINSVLDIGSYYQKKKDKDDEVAEVKAARIKAEQRLEETRIREETRDTAADVAAEGRKTAAAKTTKTEQQEYDETRGVKLEKDLAKANVKGKAEAAREDRVVEERETANLISDIQTARKEGAAETQKQHEAILYQRGYVLTETGSLRTITDQASRDRAAQVDKQIAAQSASTAYGQEKLTWEKEKYKSRFTDAERFGRIEAGTTVAIDDAKTETLLNASLAEDGLVEHRGPGGIWDDEFKKYETLFDEKVNGKLTPAARGNRKAYVRNHKTDTELITFYTALTKGEGLDINAMPMKASPGDPDVQEMVMYRKKAWDVVMKSGEIKNLDDLDWSVYKAHQSFSADEQHLGPGAEDVINKYMKDDPSTKFQSYDDWRDFVILTRTDLYARGATRQRIDKAGDVEALKMATVEFNTLLNEQNSEDPNSDAGAFAIIGQGLTSSFAFGNQTRGESLHDFLFSTSSNASEVAAAKRNDYGTEDTISTLDRDAKDQVVRYGLESIISLEGLLPKDWQTRAARKNVQAAPNESQQIEGAEQEPKQETPQPLAKSDRVNDIREGWAALKKPFQRPVRDLTKDERRLIGRFPTSIGTRVKKALRTYDEDELRRIRFELAQKGKDTEALDNYFAVYLTDKTDYQRIQ